MVLPRALRSMISCNFADGGGVDGRRRRWVMQTQVQTNELMRADKLKKHIGHIGHRILTPNVCLTSLPHLPSLLAKPQRQQSPFCVTQAKS